MPLSVLDVDMAYQTWEESWKSPFKRRNTRSTMGIDLFKPETGLGPEQGLPASHPVSELSL